MTGPTSTPKPAIVFVHGFGSSEDCWTPLINLMREDEAIASRFHLDRFDYSTEWLNIHPLRRIPALKEVAEKLREHLDSETLQNRQLTLVGHSQGGLVIHSYLKHMVSHGQGRSLRWIRQVITLATPHQGSKILSPIRRLLSLLFDNPQERTLRVHDPDTADIVRSVAQHVAKTTLADRSNWPIPVTCFGGLNDRVVEKSSAQGPFTRYKPLEGDHSTILQPRDRQDDRYRELVEVLVDPIGHPNVFELESYETTISLSPLALKKYRIQLSEGLEHEVETDNLCDLVRRVKPARNNRCHEPFKIRYMAFGGSCFAIRSMSHENEAGQLSSEYEHSGGTKLDYLFTPKLDRPNEAYSLDLKIYHGFGEGRRNIHFHLGPFSVGGMVYYRRLTYELDLSKYIEAGYAVTSLPTLYWHSEDPGDCKSCKNLRSVDKQLQPISHDAKGIWRWQLVDVREGVVDLVWDVSLLNTA